MISEQTGVKGPAEEVAGESRSFRHRFQQEAPNYISPVSGSMSGNRCDVAPLDHRQAYAFPLFAMVRSILSKLR